MVYLKVLVDIFGSEPLKLLNERSLQSIKKQNDCFIFQVSRQIWQILTTMKFKGELTQELDLQFLRENQGNVQ